MGMGAGHARQARNMNAGPFQPVIDSFLLHLNAEGKAQNTATIYVEATRWFAGAYLRRKTDCTDWAQVTAGDIQRWMVYLREFGYSDSYVNNQYRALQQFFRWWSEDEETPNPMANLHPPAVKEKVVPVFTETELRKLLHACEGRAFVQRRDRAIISLFRATGVRLSELAGIRYDPEDAERTDIDLQRRELLVRGKGGKERVVKFGYETARAIDRYLRVRAQHVTREAAACGSA